MNIQEKLNSLSVSELVKIWSELEEAGSNYTVFGMGRLEANVRIGDKLKEGLGRLFILDQMEQEEENGDGGFSTASILSDLREEMEDNYTCQRYGEWSVWRHIWRRKNHEKKMTREDILNQSIESLANIRNVSEQEIKDEIKNGSKETAEEVIKLATWAVASELSNKKGE
jgi:hypothetical protein